jgi:galactose mutarotase-like enzyme
MKYPEFPYMGIWQAYDNDTPYVCVEPWCGLPSYEGKVDDLEKKNDMFHLVPGEVKKLSYSIIFN